MLQDWQRNYGGNLLIVLPDAFGTAPSCAMRRTGSPTGPASAPTARRRSRPARRSSPGGEQKGHDPRNKLLVFSDGLDVDTIEETYRHFPGRVRMAFGWGTNLTNDFEDCAPTAPISLDPISLVCKVTAANGRPAVKLSDNPAKATGMPAEIERYLRVFGDAGRVRKPVLV